jgi:hypothetical protein
LKITPGLHRGAVGHLAAVGLVGEAGGGDLLGVVLLGVARCASVSVALFMSSSHLAAIEIVALCVITVVLLWKATLLSGSFQLVDDGGVQPLAVDRRVVGHGVDQAWRTAPGRRPAACRSR